MLPQIIAGVPYRGIPEAIRAEGEARLDTRLKKIVREYYTATVNKEGR